MLLATATVITVVYQWHPYTSKTLNKLQIMQEMTVVVLCDLLITFNSGGWLNSDQTIRFTIGWVYLGVFTLSIVISFFVMVMVSLTNLRYTLMRRKPKKRQDSLKAQRRMSRIMKRRRSVH